MSCSIVSYRKSKRGCKQCRSRKVKCNEEKPQCRTCRLRKEDCMYPLGTGTATSRPQLMRDVSSTSSTANPPPPPRPKKLLLPLAKQLAVRRQTGGEGGGIPKRLAFRPREMSLFDDTDMKMLWLYTLETYSSFALAGAYTPAMEAIFQVKVMEYAFRSPFLMDLILALSSLHLGRKTSILSAVGPDGGSGGGYSSTFRNRSWLYQLRGFAGLRAAMEKMDPADFPAMIMSSLLMPAVCSAAFRDDGAAATTETKPLYIIDWMAMWRGINTIIEAVSPNSLYESGLAPLFYRPLVMDMERAIAAVPVYLVQMVLSCCGESDEDPNQGEQSSSRRTTYLTVLQHLGSLYKELRSCCHCDGGLFSLSPVFYLRIFTFFSWMPLHFISLARKHEPEALVILAYYCCFLKLAPEIVWWAQDIADRQIGEIAEAVIRDQKQKGQGEYWRNMMEVPLQVAVLEDEVEIVRMTLGGDGLGWGGGGDATPLLTVEEKDGSGNEKWTLSALGPVFDQLRLADTESPVELSREHTLLGGS